MNEAEALDLALPILRRAGLAAAALDALNRRRLDLAEVLFLHTGPDEDGRVSYRIGDPHNPAAFRPKACTANAVRALHVLVSEGTLRAADWAPEAKDPVETMRKRIGRVLDDLYAVHRPLVDAIGPLDSADGFFVFHHRPGRPRITTTQADQ
jgi:hypothetical protein